MRALHCVANKASHELGMNCTSSIPYAAFDGQTSPPRQVLVADAASTQACTREPIAYILNHGEFTMLAAENAASVACCCMHGATDDS